MGKTDRALGDRVDVAGQRSRQDVEEVGLEEGPAVVARRLARYAGRRRRSGTAPETRGPAEPAGNREAAAERVPPRADRGGRRPRPRARARLRQASGHGRLVERPSPAGAPMAGWRPRARGAPPSCDRTGPGGEGRVRVRVRPRGRACYTRRCDKPHERRGLSRSGFGPCSTRKGLDRAHVRGLRRRPHDHDVFSGVGVEGLQSVQVDAAQGVTRITLNRPPANVLSVEMMQELASAIESSSTRRTSSWSRSTRPGSTSPPASRSATTSAIGPT